MILLHLVARVGGIGANREHPDGFIHDNPSAPLKTGLMKSMLLLHESWVAGVEKRTTRTP
jgi:GDP-L-fucose synthase